MYTCARALALCVCVRVCVCARARGEGGIMFMYVCIFASMVCASSLSFLDGKICAI